MTAQREEDGSLQESVQAKSSDSKEKWDEVWRRQSGRRSGGARGLLRKCIGKFLPNSQAFQYLLAYWMEREMNLPASSVLEIGGAGHLGLLLLPKVSHYGLLDYSEEAIERARRVIGKKANISLIHGDMFTFEPETEPDIVLSIGLIEHFFGAERREVVQAHSRMTSKYVCIGAPADTPQNWWRHFGYEKTKLYPSQRPICEEELWDMCVDSGLSPVCMTRLDPSYGTNPGRFRRRFAECKAAWWPSKRSQVDVPDGGVIVMLAEK
ncbi:MAG: class I SAM-dependent methyltransferase [Phycisphaerae bacterium]